MEKFDGCCADFRALWNDIGASGNPIPVYEDLKDRYSGPQRVYHSMVHVNNALEDVKKTTAKRPNKIKTAIWFHDAVYDTQRKDNEEKSAELAETALRGADVPVKFVGDVKSLILATKHDSAPRDSDAALMMDIDLASLASSRSMFKENNMDIREEYSWASDQEYREGRKKFAEGLLSRPSIFHTEQFRKKYEEKARRNLEFLSKGNW